MKILKPEGATAVAFKDEDEEEGVSIGPVWFVVEDELIPVMENTLWMDKPEAIKMAKHYGLPFKDV